MKKSLAIFLSAITALCFSLTSAAAESTAEEAQRLAHIASAATFEEAMQWMTPDEIAAELGIPVDFTAEHDPLLMLEKASGAGYLNIDVSIAAQTVSVQGSHTQSFSDVVSTGKKGYGTVTGCYHPTMLSKNHWSRKYKSPMPWAVFFHGGYALHQTPYVTLLGKKASHGCVRLSGPTAKLIYQSVAWYRENYGNASITICVR